MRSNERVFALGFFDGVHIGHQALLKACRKLAAQLGCETAAITFDAHPKSLFSDRVPPLISSAWDRQNLLRQYGMEHIQCFPAVREVMLTPWGAFLEQLVEHGAVGFVCGDDFHFGHKGEGNAQKLQEFCDQHHLPCIIVPEQSLKGQRISSTLIRRLLEEGEMESATKFLGHPHILTGHVLHGQKLGRKLGVPTANLVIPAGVVVPKFGVYACKANIGGIRYPAVANVGIRPTVNGTGITVEPWILDFEGDLYGQEIQIEFYRFLRPEVKFETLTALQQQILEDAAATRHYFEHK